MSPLKFMRRVAGSDRRGGGGDPDYEEVGPVTIHLTHTADGRGDGKHCEVCGAAQASVRCQSCSGQVFCVACDNVFHKHPRRTGHIRKAMEGVRPPLPPKVVEVGPGMLPPQPPPRKNKSRPFMGGPGISRKAQSNSMEGGGGTPSGGRTIMGSLKRFMGSRPLPAPPGSSRGDNSSAVHSNLIRSLTSPNLANDEEEACMAVAIPQTVVDMSTGGGRKYPAPPPPPGCMPPPSPQCGPSYPTLLPRAPVVPPGGHQRKLSTVSLHQPPTVPKHEDNRQSMIDGGSWDASGRYRSQSVSDEQWSQLLAAQGHAAPSGGIPPRPVDQSASTRGITDQSTHASDTGSSSSRSRFNTTGGGGSSLHGGQQQTRAGMMSSASVCDLNTLASQQQQQQQQQQHQHQQQQQIIPHMGGMQQSGSFQQLNMVPYTGGMMWGMPPPPGCDMCHAPPMYPPPLPSHGMKRAASNLSMNMSSASSDVTGYPWQPPPGHMHHHMPPMYPGYYPPPPPPHMMQGSMQGSSISIPDSMAAFSKVSNSPAPSVRSSSRRSQKSSKSRSFSTADLNRRARSIHRSDTSDSTTSSPSLDDDPHNVVKSSYSGGVSLAWQCDHCTFINQAGSRACGMCSKSQHATSQSRSNRRVSERRRTERRFSTRRTDHNEDDRDQSDYENDAKQSSAPQDRRDNNRKDRSSKSLISSRTKKKVRRRGGSSGSASDVVDELERQLSDMKVSKSRGIDYDGESSRIKERDRDRDRGSRKREGLSSRLKSRSKNNSERSRTPGRPSPENQSPQGSSPNGNSPIDDEEVFPTEQTGEKKTENNSNNSNEGTLVCPGNSDETIMPTEFKKSKSDSKVKRSKSTLSSRASTPGPVVEIHHAEVQILPSNEIMEIEVAKPLEIRQSELLEVPKPKEKSPSPFNRQNSHPDTEEPSFANTLDDIATMGTNEVADMDLYMDERPFSALPVNVDDIQQFIPTMKFVQPLSENEEIIETALLSEHEGYMVEKADSISIKVEVNEAVKAHEKLPEVAKVVEKSKNVDQSYESVQEPIEEVVPQTIPEKNHDNAGEANPETDYYVDGETASIAIEIPDESQSVYEDQGEEVVEESGSRNVGSLEDINNIQQSESFVSAVGMGSGGHLERQFTPLSFSSSDAAFYSQTDSPDESLSEKLRDRPSGSQTQTVIAAVGEDELVTALETLRSSAADLRSSRETIRSSSVDDLPYSEEEKDLFPSQQEEEEGLEHHGSVPSLAEHVRLSGAASGRADALRATSPAEGGYLSSDAYEGLSFQDAVSGYSAFASIHKSASDQMLTKVSARLSEEQRPRAYRRRNDTGEALDERYLTVEEIISKRKQETMKREGLELVHVLREAEKAGYQAEEVGVALPLCGERGPLEWLTDNWRHMVDTVRTLASNYGREKMDDNVGTITESEARAALRAHKGNIWAAVTDSVEQRQNKLVEVSSKGDFPRAAVVEALQRNDGDVEAAYQDLSSTGDVLVEMDDSTYQNYQPNVLQPTQDHYHQQNSEVYANVSSTASCNRGDNGNKRRRKQSTDEEPTSLYSNINLKSNPQQVAKTEALLQELEEQAPNLSRDLKLKIVQAILEEEPNSAATEQPQRDSDEESTIEELLAREQNPTFYEYFTAVDLDEDGESYTEDASESDEGSDQAASYSSSFVATPLHQSAVVPPSIHQSGTVPPPIHQSATATAAPPGEYQRQYKSIQQDFNSRIGGGTLDAPPTLATHPSAELLYVRKEESGDEDFFGDSVVMRRKPTTTSRSNDPELRSSISYEGSSDEEESVSVTTGRLSLTLSHSSDKDGTIDVTSATVQKEEIQTYIAPKTKTSASASKKSALASGTRKSDIRHIAQLEQDYNEATTEDQTDNEAGPLSPSPENPEVPSSADETQQPPVPSDKPLQPPVKKASSIIGKAIAKAMARESTVREGSHSPPLYSPVSSRESTPASFMRESTSVSSFLDTDDSTPVSTTPMSNTPRSTPDMGEEIAEHGQAATDSEEEEDLLRSLDTIPEEEEISDRTESGRRLLSRASSNNIKLPFNPTSVVQLGTTSLVKSKDVDSLGKMKSSTTIQNQEQPASDSIIHQPTIKDVPEHPAMKTNEITDDSDQYQDSRLSEKSDDNPDEDSDSSTPHQVEDNNNNDDDDNSLASIPQPAIDDTNDDVLSEAQSSTSHQYYNTREACDPANSVTYYNDAAAQGLGEGKIQVDPNDYESMYSIKRDLDMLRESSSEVSDKIDSLGTRKKKGPIKDIGPPLKSALKSSTSQSSLNTKTKLNVPDSPSSPISGAQLLAEENMNTVKRSPKTADASLTKSKTAPAIASSADGKTSEEPAKTIPTKQEESSVDDASAVNIKPKNSKSKVKKKKKDESDYYSSSDQTDASKSNEEATVIQSVKTSAVKSTENVDKEGETTTTEAEFKINNNDQIPSETTARTSSASSDTKENAQPTPPLVNEPIPDTSNLTVKPKTPLTPVQKKTPRSPVIGRTSSSTLSPTPPPVNRPPSSSTLSPTPPPVNRPSSSSTLSPTPPPVNRPSSSLTLSPTPNRPQSSSSILSRGAMDSSGESEDEDKNVLAQRVSLVESRQLLPNLLTKLEGLKGREPDYEEVQELKRQITDLKKTLQSQMTQEDRELVSPVPKMVSPVPKIMIPSRTGTPTNTIDPVQETPSTLHPPPRTEEEATLYEQLRFDRTVRRLLAEGQAGSYEKAELAAHLLSLSFDEDDSIAAAQECSSIYGALHYLQQDCELCAEKYPMKMMVSMLHCTHRCCMECAKTYFTYQIKTKNIREMKCPFCNEPSNDSPEDVMTEYFNHMDILLKGIVDEDMHELFQRKLRDLTLMSDPNFRWCNKCSSGFISNPRARKLICPDCKDVTCAHCRLAWEAQHEGISCDAFEKWKHENDPEAQAQGVAKHLAENGITCPKCKVVYSLAKGGCMHFTCIECKYEFCSGCSQPFRQGTKCSVGPYCERLGLHAHHPRNCLFYLRDKDPPQLQQLLKENDISFDTEPPEEVGEFSVYSDGTRRRHCRVPEQKETPDGLIDDTCGRTILTGNAGLCRLHYVEYLVEKINSHHLDPVIIFDEADMRVCLRRNGKAVPVRRWESEKLYRDKLIKLIKEQLPL